MSTHDSNRACLSYKIVHGHITYLHRTKPSTIDTLSQFKATNKNEILKTVRCKLVQSRSNVVRTPRTARVRRRIAAMFLRGR